MTNDVIDPNGGRAMGNGRTPAADVSPQAGGPGTLRASRQAAAEVMTSVDELLQQVLDEPFPTPHQVVAELRRTGGAFSEVTDQLSSLGLQRIAQAGPAAVARRRAATIQKAKGIALTERPESLRVEMQSLRSLEMALAMNPAPVHLAQLRTRLDYHKQMGDRSREIQLKIEILRRGVQERLLPALSQMLRQSYVMFEDLESTADEDIQRLTELIALVDENLDRALAQIPSSSVQVPIEWRQSAALKSFRSSAAAVVSRRLAGEIGSLSGRTSEQILAELTKIILPRTPALPGIHTLLSPAGLRSFLESLGYDGGPRNAASRLWQIQPPVAQVRKPAAVDLPSNLPPGCSVTTEDGPPDALVVRRFQFLPLPAIPHWQAWLDADASTVQASQGVVVSSSEPWRDVEHQALLGQIQAVQQGWQLPTVAPTGTVSPSAVDSPAGMVPPTHPSEVDGGVRWD